MNKFQKLELIGVLVIFVLGFIFHDAYKFTKIPIFPVNESIFEHQKLYLLGFIIYTIIELNLLSDVPDNFIFSKFLGLLLTIFISIISYTFYQTYISSEHNLLVTILIYFASILIGQFFSYKIILENYSFKNIETIGILSFIFLSTLFIYLTYYPPNINLFYDPITKSYGIN